MEINDGVKIEEYVHELLYGNKSDNSNSTVKVPTCNRRRIVITYDQDNESDVVIESMTNDPKLLAQDCLAAEYAVGRFISRISSGNLSYQEVQKSIAEVTTKMLMEVVISDYY